MFKVDIFVWIGCTLAQLVALLLCVKKVLGSNPSLVFFCIHGSVWVSRLPSTVQMLD